MKNFFKKIKKNYGGEQTVKKDFFVFTVSTIFLILLFLTIILLVYKLNPVFLEFYFIRRYLVWTKIAYILSIFLIPVLGLAFYTLFNRFIKPSKKLIIPAILISLLLFFGYIFFILKIDFDLFYKWSPLKKAMYISPRTWILALLITYCIFYYNKFLLLKSNLKKKILIDRLIIISIFLTSLYMARFAIITEYSRYMTNALNLGAVMHSAIQVYLGKGLLINIKSQYGLYAQFL
jgi:hypothetical protein